MTRQLERLYMKRAFQFVSRRKIYTHNNGYVMALFKTSYNFEPYCLQFEKIENYELAKADNFKGWHCHHRLEEHCTRTELIEAGLYYNRTPSELIFLTSSEHAALHNKFAIERGLPVAIGHHFSPSDEFKEKQRKRVSSLIWVNNGIENKRVLPNEIPEGFIKGKLPHGTNKLKGKKWFINSEGRRCWV